MSSPGPKAGRRVTAGGSRSGLSASTISAAVPAPVERSRIRVIFAGLMMVMLLGYGKLGDLYGRKRVLQSAVLLFLLGSALCGQAAGMKELIAFRAVQGLGAGGLIVLTQAVIGDVVPPRERGKYQGLFGAVFGVSSVAGPLLGRVIVQAVS